MSLVWQSVFYKARYTLVTLYKYSNGKYRQQGQPIKWSGTASKTITLDKNSRYQIKIEPYAVKYKTNFRSGAAFNPYPCNVFPLKLWSPSGWTKNCSWSVSSYNRINSCCKLR